MAKYNFDEIIWRRNTNSIKWDRGEEDVLPMDIADMDFKTAPIMLDALAEKLSQGVLGYNTIPADFKKSIQNWLQKQHNFTIDEDHLIPATGILSSLSAILKTFVRSDENIILQVPVYNHFFTLLKNGGYSLVSNRLLYDSGKYEIDFNDLEIKAANPKTRLLLLCNPQNPVGKVWSKQDLQKIAEICSRHKVMVVSDEIHSDLIFTGHRHIPFASVAQNYRLEAVTCGSPCKTFNFSGLPVSYLISHDKNILAQIHKTLELQENGYPNILAVEALIAAYTKGEDWLMELKEYVYQNYLYLVGFFSEYVPQIKVLPLEATYLVWLDCTDFQKSSDELSKLLLDEGKIRVNSGKIYGDEGDGFLRINIACPKELLIDGLTRIKKVLG